jgi:WD40 repeat protein
LRSRTAVVACGLAAAVLIGGPSCGRGVIENLTPSASNGGAGSSGGAGTFGGAGVGGTSGENGGGGGSGTGGFGIAGGSGTAGASGTGGRAAGASGQSGDASAAGTSGTGGDGGGDRGGGGGGGGGGMAGGRDGSPDAVDGGPNVTDGPMDGPLDGPGLVVCSRNRSFGTPTLVPGLGGLAAGVGTTRFSADERMAYLTIGTMFGANADSDIAVLTRSSRAEPFKGPLAELLSEINLPHNSEGAPTLTADGLTLYFHSSRPAGEWRLWESTRIEPDADFPAPTAMMPPLNVYGEGTPYVAPSGNLYFHSWRDGTSDIWMARRTDGGFTSPERISISGLGDEEGAVVSPDELTIYYQRRGLVTDNGIWMATRDKITEPFRNPRPLSQLTVTNSNESLPAWISPDGCRLYFSASDAQLRPSLYVAERSPGGDDTPDGGAPPEPDSGAPDGRDGAPDGGPGDGPGLPRTCAATQRFGTPTLVPQFNDLAGGIDMIQFSPDERVAYVAIGPWGAQDIGIAYRPTRFDPFEPIILLASVNGSDDSAPSVTDDGLTMYFQSTRGGNYGVYAATRTATDKAFSTPVPISALNASSTGAPYVSPDGSSLYVHSSLAGSVDLWVAKRSGSGFGPPERLAPSVDGADEYHPVVSPDELVLYYLLARGQSDDGIWIATRSSRQAAFSNPVFLSELDSPSYYAPAPTWISPDGCRLYFNALDFNYRVWLYVAERTPQAP